MNSAELLNIATLYLTGVQGCHYRGMAMVNVDVTPVVMPTYP